MATQEMHTWLRGLGVAQEVLPKASGGGAAPTGAAAAKPSTAPDPWAGGGNAKPAAAAGGSLPQPMLPDCKPIRGKVPGPAEHLLCAKHGHVVDIKTKMIIAHSVDEYKKMQGLKRAVDAVASIAGPVIKNLANAASGAPEPPKKKNQIVDTLNGKGSDAEKAQALRKAGYCQFDVAIIAIDYRGQPMSGYSVSARFTGPGVDAGLAIGKVEGGAFNHKGTWAAREGIVTVDALDMNDHGDVSIPHNPSGVASYKVPDKGPLKLKIVQEYEEVEVGKKESDESGSKYGHETELEVGAELDLGVGTIGDKGTRKTSSEQEYKKGNERSTARKQRLPTNSLKVEQI